MIFYLLRMNWLVYIFWPIVKFTTCKPEIQKILKVTAQNSDKISNNLPNYVIYHILKINPNRDLKHAKLLQMLWFSFFRVFLYSLYVKDCFKNIDHNLTKLTMFFIYFAGAYWTIGQFKGVYTSFSRKTIKSS